jgi:Lon protease-like protein
MRQVPLFPLKSLLYPGGPLSLRIFEPRYVNMVTRCLREQAPFVVVQLLEGAEAGGGVISTAATGTEATIVDFDRLPDGLLGLTCVGGRRVRILSTEQQADGLHLAQVDDLEVDPPVAVPAEYQHLVRALRLLWARLPDIYRQWVPQQFEDAVWVGNRLSELSPFDAAIRQGLLEMTDPLERLRYLSPLVRVDPTESH